MNLLFSRSQMRSSFLSLIPLRIGGTVTFRLKAELELSNEELILARKYSFTKATLLRSDDDDDLGRAYRPALFLGISAALAAAMFIPTNSFGRGFDGIILKAAAVPSIGFVSFVVLTVLYFFSLRKHVSVDQLTNGGRMFYCHSVVELDEREAELLDICKRFYHTLEKAKNWGGREINPLPDGEPFYLNDPQGSERQVVIDRAMHQAGQVTRKLLTPFSVEHSANPQTDEPAADAEDGIWSNLKSMLNQPNEWQSKQPSPTSPAATNPPAPQQPQKPIQPRSTQPPPAGAPGSNPSGPPL